ncbi:MAG TPA: (4Fe-4S)-binding protein [Saprospiraceae bacterium]|nr:(4Fe-4S)-binding protein [Saprospiraceae bacterium]
MSRTKEYTNGEVTIVWKSNLCTHSKNCVNGLPAVFDVEARPWINAEGASTQDIIDQVNKCPSGALTTYLNEEGKPKAEVPEDGPQVSLKVTPNGPILVDGAIHLTYPDGKEEDKAKGVALCRCGASGKKPFCDGSHNKIDFKG